jgi:hypothetical protein
MASRVFFFVGNFSSHSETLGVSGSRRERAGAGPARKRSEILTLLVRSVLFPCSLGVAALLGGCESSGPVTGISAVVAPCATVAEPLEGELRGVLVVYSENRRLPDDYGPPRWRRVPYEISSADHSVAMKVSNSDKTSADPSDPTPVWLEAGSYFVSVRTKVYGTVILPVVIRPNEITLVDIAGDAPWPNRTDLLKNNPVCLPKGEVVGWRDTGPASSGMGEE